MLPRDTRQHKLVASKKFKFKTKKCQQLFNPNIWIGDTTVVKIPPDTYTLWQQPHATLFCYPMTHFPCRAQKTFI